MHLSSLTLKGFKSFAAPTTLRLEPGITCVVGPNGSGKSNVVDAVAWVLGEQGAKNLRGGAMSDVIFAGTSQRPALGRAEVTLTIDNSDGSLPIDYSEVSVSRLLYRSGESEYAVNGTPCRLLDVQELLSDTGIGRELHVIVGQGQLDAVLAATPETRRGFIEEAAGVLKHRKRKERALRKLESMQANLTRLTDLTTELRRQLSPLGKQAEAARRATGISAALRDARLRLLAEDLVTASGALQAEVRDEEAVRARQVEAEAALVAARETEARLEAALATDTPRVTLAQDVWYQLAAVQERLRGTATLAAERARHLGTPPEAGHRGRDPEELEAEADAVGVHEHEVLASLTDARAALTAVSARRAGLEERLAAQERAVVAAARGAADRREGLARLAGSVDAQRSRATAAEEEIGRMTAALQAARDRADAAAVEVQAVVAEIPALDEGETGLDERHEAAAAALAAAEQRLVDLLAEEREAERDRATWSARRDALGLGLRRKDGAGALLGGEVPGVLGSVAALLHVEPGLERAVAAALGAAADAVAVATVTDAATALAHLLERDAGRAGLLVGAGQPAPAAHSLPDGLRPLADAVTAPPALAGAVAGLLAGVVVVVDVAGARDAVLAHPRLRAVTLSGDLLGRDWAVGGSASAPTTLETQAAHDEADERLAEATRTAERLRFALSTAREERSRAGDAVQAALTALHESDARVAAVQERLALLGAQARGGADEAERLERARGEAEQARDTALAGLGELEERLGLAESLGDDGSGEAHPPGELDRLSAACAVARHEEVEARLALRTSEERARALAGRADQLRRAAATERAGRERLERVRAARVLGASLARDVAGAAAVALERIGVSLAVAEQERDTATAARTVREGELLAARAGARETAEQLGRLRDFAHRDEVARAEQRLRVEQLEGRATEEFAVTPEQLVGEYGPAVPVPADEEGGQPSAYDPVVQQRRAAAAERQLALLGRVNPLAMEEFAALEERHGFLAAQLEDLRATRKDLMGIVRDVDARIHDVFAAAFADTAREFSEVFATLFPGGEGRLVLTDPDDVSLAGVEVEARPAGKRVKRLSLLSGGERSLTAVALLLAIFRARPSPFYVLDEVEAALDDVNLGRLLVAMQGLRDRSQLIVITHQKRTMEIADALYGVTMRGDGVSTVISQRLRERAEVPAG